MTADGRSQVTTLVPRAEGLLHPHHTADLAGQPLAAVGKLRHHGMETHGGVVQVLGVLVQVLEHQVLGDASLYSKAQGTTCRRLNTRFTVMQACGAGGRRVIAPSCAILTQA